MQKIKVRNQEGKKIFSDNLIKFREKNHLSQKALAKLTNINQQNISSYEHMITFPNAENLSKIAKILNISEIELLGIDVNNKSRNYINKVFHTKGFLKENTAINDNFKELVNERGTSISSVLNKLGLKRIDIFNADQAKYVKYIIYTGQYLDTSLDKLAGRDDGFTMRPGLYANIRRIAGMKGIMISQIEKKYNMPLGTLKNIDHKKCIKTLLKLADFFRVSLDRLVKGKINSSSKLNDLIINDPAVQDQLNKIDNKTKLSDTITKLANNNNYSVPALLATIGSNEDEFNELSHDKNIKLLIKIANLLSVSVDSLINNDIANNIELNNKKNNNELISAKSELSNIKIKIMDAQTKLDDLYRTNNQSKIDIDKIRQKSLNELHDLDDKIKQAKLNYQKVLDKSEMSNINNQYQFNNAPLNRLFKQAESLTANQILIVQSLISEFINLNNRNK